MSHLTAEQSKTKRGFPLSGEYAPDREVWEQQPNESDEWYGRFHHFLLLGSERTLEETFRTMKAAGTLNSEAERPHEGWYSTAYKWRWKERARAWDGHQYQQIEELWLERQAQLREADWLAGQQLRDLATRLLMQLPESVRESLTLSQLVKALEIGSKLQRLAADEPTDIINLSGAALDDNLASALAALAESQGRGTGLGQAVKPDNGAEEGPPQEG